MTKINGNIYVGDTGKQLKDFVKNYELIYENILPGRSEDFSCNYNFAGNGRIYEVFIEGSGTPVDYWILPDSNWQTYVGDRIGMSDGTFYSEHYPAGTIQFRLDNSFAVHYTFQLLSNGRISVVGDWINRTINGSSYTRHITAISNSNNYGSWGSLYFAGTFPSGMHVSIYKIK